MDKTILYKITVRTTTEVMRFRGLKGDNYISEIILTEDPNYIDITKAVADALQKTSYKVKELTVSITSKEIEWGNE